MQKSIPPQKERFTSVPPKNQIVRLRSPLWFEFNLTPAAVAAGQRNLIAAFSSVSPRVLGDYSGKAEDYKTGNAITGGRVAGTPPVFTCHSFWMISSLASTFFSSNLAVLSRQRAISSQSGLLLLHLLQLQERYVLVGRLLRAFHQNRPILRNGELAIERRRLFSRFDVDGDV
jgi:hypothetical protein